MDWKARRLESSIKGHLASTYAIAIREVLRWKVPGRKTDVKDAEWIADLLRHGLLTGSFIPP
ncbi:MAG: IS110 family transposase, partial [Coleofasciculus sp. S288]|nr:IS110 family transposase [Coleofasciculus sp. S288]